MIWGAVSQSVANRFQALTVIRNIDDIVTHLPPKILGYTHVGNLLEIGKRGKYSKIDAHRPKNILNELLIYEQG